MALHSKSFPLQHWGKGTDWERFIQEIVGLPYRLHILVYFLKCMARNKAFFVYVGTFPKSLLKCLLFSTDPPPSSVIVSMHRNMDVVITICTNKTEASLICCGWQARSLATRQWRGPPGARLHQGHGTVLTSLSIADDQQRLPVIHCTLAF